VKPFKKFEILGMPYHGAAVNGQLTTANGTLSIGGFGHDALIARNPLAPGVSRTPAQQTSDTANGYEWRDYLILQGKSRQVNGADALGESRWLYCDSNGVPWIMSIEFATRAPGSASQGIEIWRRGVFGRFGRDYSNLTDELLLTFTWAPTLPTWYGGSRTIPELLDAGSLYNDAIAIVPSEDGASVYFNIASGSGLWKEAFPDLFITGQFNPEARNICGLISITISGAGDLATTGAGIAAAASLTHDIADLYLTRTVTNSDSGGSAGSETWTGSPGTIQQDGPPAEDYYPGNLDWTSNYVLGRDGDGQRVVLNETVIETLLYRTHEGDVTRYRLEQNNSTTTWTENGQYTETVNWTARQLNPSLYIWDYPSCVGNSTSNAYIINNVQTTERQREYFTAFGQVVGEFDAIKTYNQTAYGGCQVWPNDRCGGLVQFDPGCGAPTQTSESYTINGIDYMGSSVPNFSDADAFVGIQLDAFNVVQTQTHWNQPNDTTRNLERYIVTASQLHGAAIQYTDISTYPKPGFGDPDANQGFLEGHCYQAVTDEWAAPGTNTKYV